MDPGVRCPEATASRTCSVMYSKPRRVRTLVNRLFPVLAAVWNGLFSVEKLLAVVMCSLSRYCRSSSVVVFRHSLRWAG
ncbi:hypothetical protein ACFFX0_20565 [Citricoccus parietis]|uniref:Uncharacterized protein n=1 Tax=Citricoccus parietis TaxID=592307 RepID=A0ABV5G483_9MICC